MSRTAVGVAPAKARGWGGAAALAALLLVVCALWPLGASAATLTFDPALYKCTVLTAGPPQRMQCQGAAPRPEERLGWQEAITDVSTVAIDDVSHTGIVSAGTVYSYTAPDGTIYNFTQGPKTLQQCNPLAESCWACEFVGAFAEISDAYARFLYDLFRPVVTSVLSYLFAIWLVVVGIRLVLPVGEDPPSILRDFAVRSCLFLLATFALTDTGRVVYFDSVYAQAIASPTQTSSTILATIGSMGGGPVPGSGACGYTRRALEGTALGTDGALPAGTISALVCQVQAMSKIANNGVVLGVQNLKNVSLWDLKLTPFVAGVILIVLYGILAISFPFYFVDILFRIAFLSAFAPFLVGCFVFKPSRKYAVVAAAGIVQSAVQLLCCALLFGLAGAVQAIAPAEAFKAAGKPPPSGLPLDMGTLIDAACGRWAAYRSSIGLELGDVAFWLLAMAGVLAILMSGRIGGLLSSIFGFRDTGGLGQRAASAAKKAAAPAVAAPAAVPGLALGAGAYQLGRWSASGGVRGAVWAQAAGRARVDRIKGIFTGRG